MFFNLPIDQFTDFSIKKLTYWPIIDSPIGQLIKNKSASQNGRQSLVFSI
jgi:hypothetical protein